MSERESLKRMVNALKKVVGPNEVPGRSYEEFAMLLLGALDSVNAEAERKTRQACAEELAISLAERTAHYRRHNLEIQARYKFVDCPNGPKCNQPACPHLHTRV